MKWTRKRFVIAGVALIVVTNAVALGGAAYNRSGAPDSTLRLSERELQASWSGGERENSGLSLQLRWRVLGAGKGDAYSYRYGGAGHIDPAWLDAAKMAELGFDTKVPDQDGREGRAFGRELGRDALLVLELDGPAYQESIKRAAAEAERLRAMGKDESVKLADEIVVLEAKGNSRLFVVDAGLDAAPLRAKYPDQARYAIVRGQVRPAGSYSSVRGSHSGHIAGVSAETINVPLHLRPALDKPAYERGDYSPASVAARPKYTAIVSFGKRFEPWLVDVSGGIPP